VMSVTHRRADTSVIASRTYERSPSGEPTRITNHDGSYVLITYDDALRVQSEAYRDAGGGVLDNIEYTYDLDGNRTTRRRGATIATSTLEEYTYAPGDELTTVTVAGTPTQTWEHDEAGRTTRIARGGHDQHLAYDADDHITSIVDGAAETRWQFDAEGRRTRREDLSGGVTDSAHRYVQGPTTDASLDSAHMVTSDAGAEELGYVFAPIPGGAEHPLFRYDPATGEAVYYLQDSMGSVIGLVDHTATQTATFEYDGFGGERSATGTLASLPVASRGDYRFHGMWLDSSVGLYYVRARVYDAEVGRFLSNDPAEGRRSTPESFELTRFAAGRPPTARDPAGRETLGGEMAGVAGTATGASLALESAQALAVALLRELGRQLIWAFASTVVFSLSQDFRDAVREQVYSAVEAQLRENRERRDSICAGVADVSIPIPAPEGYAVPSPAWTGGRSPGAVSMPVGIVYCGRNVSNDGNAVLLAFITSNPVVGRTWPYEEHISMPSTPGALGPPVYRFILRSR